MVEMKSGSGFVPPAVTTPENTTATNMWAWIYNELQRITTTELNPIRLRVFRFDSTALMPYHATLQTIALMFGEFFEKDFPAEKVRIDALFKEFINNYNDTVNLKSQTVGIKFAQAELNTKYMRCLDALKLADELLARIRQEKGFGYKENPTFVINDRCAKALSINNNIGKEILKIFKRQTLRKNKLKNNVDKIEAFLHPAKTEEKEEESPLVEEQEVGILDESVPEKGDN